MHKNRILIVTDSPAITTGFSNVGVEITKTLLATGKYDISTLAWFHPFNREKKEFVKINYPCPLYFTQPDDQSDNYGHKSGEAIVREVIPDYVLSLGDSVSGERCVPIQINNVIDVISFDELWDFCIKNKEVSYIENDRQVIKLANNNIKTLTQSGKFEKILFISRHLSKNTVIIRQKFGETRCTENHSVYGFISGFCKPDEITEINHLTRSDYVDNRNLEDIEDFKVIVWGYYISEGSASSTKAGNRIRISNTKKEFLEKAKNNLIKYIYSIDNKISNISYDWPPSQSCGNAVSWNTNLFNELTNKCGSGFSEKHIPIEIFNASIRSKLLFLHSLIQGDGSYMGRDLDIHDLEQFEYWTSSLKLASGISFLLNSLGIDHSFGGKKKGTKFIFKGRNTELTKFAYRIRTRNHDGCRNQTAKVYSENIKDLTMVYDLTVENDHTFVDALGCVILHNTWMTDWVPSVRNISKAKWISYFPVDGLPFPSSWKHITRLMDVPVTFTEFGRNAIRAQDPFIDPIVINHGIDTSIFKRYSPEEIFKFKQQVMPGMENKFIVGTGGRNQPRKNYPAIFEAFSKFSKDKPNVYMYAHTTEQDVGWDLADLANRYNIKKRIIIPNMRACLGIPKEKLALILNCFDIGIYPYTREGWGIFGSDTLASGVPILFTNSGPMPEYAAGCGEAIDVKNYVTSTHYGLLDAYVDVDDMVMKMNRLYYNPDLRLKYAKAGLEKAKELDWKVVNKKWVEIFSALDQGQM